MLCGAEVEAEAAVVAGPSIVPPTVFSAITGGLFSGGLVCSDPEVVGSAVDAHAAERKAFLDDVVAGNPATAGGRLANWLSRVVDQVCVRWLCCGCSSRVFALVGEAVAGFRGGCALVCCVRMCVFRAESLCRRRCGGWGVWGVWGVGVLWFVVLVCVCSVRNHCVDGVWGVCGLCGLSCQERVTALTARRYVATEWTTMVPSLTNVKTNNLVFDPVFDAGGSDAAISSMTSAMAVKPSKEVAAPAAAKPKYGPVPFCSHHEHYLELEVTPRQGIRVDVP